ncbi:MAG: transcriptional regulator [Candidatus Nanohaloarchaea archaeon]|nr:transcriptional regulator [Candidatus Nanohaloarchaea archaeon]
MPVTAETGESFANALVRAGYTDFYLIGADDARRLLTEKRREIIRVLKEDDVSSMRELARTLDRDIRQVSDDLDVLYEMSVIDYREKGRRKIPELRHSRIVVEPIG